MGSQLVQIKGKADEVPRESSLMRLLQLKEVYLDRPSQNDNQGL